MRRSIFSSYRCKIFVKDRTPNELRARLDENNINYDIIFHNVFGGIHVYLYFREESDLVAVKMMYSDQLI